MSGYGTPKPPGALTRPAVRFSVRALSDSAARARYRHEFLAESYGLSALAQLRHTAGLLRQCLALRAAINPQQPSITELLTPTPLKRKPLMGRLPIHHTWQRTSNPDGENYVHYAACG